MGNPIKQEIRFGFILIALREPISRKKKGPAFAHQPYIFDY
jgi:hypothetical protein